MEKKVESHGDDKIIRVRMFWIDRGSPKLMRGEQQTDHTVGLVNQFNSNQADGEAMCNETISFTCHTRSPTKELHFSK